MVTMVMIMVVQTNRTFVKLYVQLINVRDDAKKVTQYHIRFIIVRWIINANKSVVWTNVMKCV